MKHQYLQSVMSPQQHFAMAPQTKIERSTFDRSHGAKTTLNGNYLVPIFVDEVLPGDTHKLSLTTLARFATPIVPIMDNLYADVFFFFVPNRLVWENWERFNGAQDNPGDSTDFLVPSLDLGSFNVGEIQDQMGIPPNLPVSATVKTKCSTLPFRGYNLIFNTWFRDQNLTEMAPFTKDDGGTESWTYYELLKRAKRPDYFTSSLPWPQKGPAVTLPLGTSAPIKLQSGWTTANNTALSSAHTVDGVMYQWNDPTHPMYADLSSATAATINAIREAFQIQKLFERDARGGTRYVEIIKSHFQTVSPDFRLQRPELIGRGSTRVNINPVAQTSSTDTTTPQGNLAAYGTFSHNGVGFTHSFVEHGYVLGIINIRADITYQQGLARHWSRRTRFDYFWPAFAHLGEQTIKCKEIYLQNDAASNKDEDIFGYQERYAEYRYKPSEIRGYFRSDVTSSIDVWHLSEQLGGKPVLSNSFIESNTPFDRVIAVEAPYPQFLLDMYFDLKSTRPMPVFAVPGYIDHF